MAKTQYPLLYLILIICIYAVVADKEINATAKTIVITILILFFPSVDIYLYSRRRRGIPDDFRYNSSDEEDIEEEDDEDEDEQIEESEQPGANEKTQSLQNGAEVAS
ncbi:hypothetical protein BZA70DRAFT_287208 [Myxozyma melibiosi]|uniref:Uncharacterized protein n=1 Tax=Myxozyma melibiosi TaxID=54550 RepID=A0ABR1FDG5_9ASCO